MSPATFEESLSRRLGGSYRLRWSNATQNWLIEQKVSRATEVPTGGSDPDVTQRVQDGYALVMQFSPTPTMKCPQCRKTLDIPRLQIGEVKCTFCQTQDPLTHDTMLWFTGYFPLCDKLIEHLEFTAPKREGKWLAEMDARNAALAAAKVRDYDNAAEAAALEHWKQVAGITQIGYGKAQPSLGAL